jgi:sugar-specific transcriptional regulator TrmB
MSILEDIGLTQRESEIYQEVLRRGEVKIGSLLVALKMHPQVIYRSIEGLISKGLITEFYRRGRKHVRAESPHTLLKIEEHRMSRLEELMPTLISMQKKGKEQTIVRVEKGNEAIIKLRTSAVEKLKKGQTYYVIGGSSERFYSAMGSTLARIEAKRVEKGVLRKMISYESQRGPMKTLDKERRLTDFRFILGGKTSPASTLIYGNTVGLFIWADEPIAITLESRELADSYRDFFEALWKVAKK